MLSQNQIKHLKSLHQKKNRQLHQQFIIEGEKMVNELLQSSFQIKQLFYTKDYTFQAVQKDVETFCISDQELQRISSLKTPNKVAALVTMPIAEKIPNLITDYSLVLDNIQDPGNLGTIIRTADWYGIHTIFCSKDTVDCYNPKVVQATMGSIYRVIVSYIDLTTLFSSAEQQNIPIIGAALDGENLHSIKIPDSALVVMGNESKGISKLTQQKVNFSVRIPSYPADSKVESLNVSIATALICSELRRLK